jgi:hypothetical protein
VTKVLWYLLVLARYIRECQLSTCIIASHIHLGNNGFRCCVYLYVYVYTSVGRVSEIFDTCQIQFSQNNLHKGLVFTFNFFKNTICQDRVSISKIWTCSHNASFHKFENNRLFFDSSHKPVITFLSNKIFIIKFLLFSFLFLKNKHKMKFYPNFLLNNQQFVYEIFIF